MSEMKDDIPSGSETAMRTVSIVTAFTGAIYLTHGFRGDNLLGWPDFQTEPSNLGEALLSAFIEGPQGNFIFGGIMLLVSFGAYMQAKQLEKERQPKALVP